MGWREITEQAHQRLVTGEGLEFEQWRGVMAAVGPVAGEDAAVASAVQMAAGAALVAGVQARPADRLVAETVAAAGSGWDGQARLAVTAMTHLALRSARGDREEQVLAAVERELLPHREPSALVVALRDWRDQVAATGVGPHEAVNIAAVQARLLVEARGWIGQVEAPAGVELAGLQDAVTVAAEVWQVAASSWRDVTRREQQSPAAVAELSRRWVAVAQAVRAEPSVARRVEAMIATGFWGVCAGWVVGAGAGGCRHCVDAGWGGGGDRR
ncbi:MAG: hypothetical protein Q4D96_03620 [Propionibacteriaceae bacterium]|nr:hypothetical protein [Propionibacteriaceae bacterium]